MKIYMTCQRKNGVEFEYKIMRHVEGEKRDTVLHVFPESRVEEAVSKLKFYQKKYCEPFVENEEDVIADIEASAEQLKSEIEAAKSALKQDYENKNVTELKKIISDLKIGTAAKTKEAMVKQIMAFIAKGG